jgi:type IV pilus secretin PilQ/predicted competence protein
MKDDYMFTLLRVRRCFDALTTIFLFVCTIHHASMNKIRVLCRYLLWCIVLLTCSHTSLTHAQESHQNVNINLPKSSAKATTPLKDNQQDDRQNTQRTVSTKKLESKELEASRLIRAEGPWIETSPTRQILRIKVAPNTKYNVFKKSQPTRIFIDLIETDISMLQTPLIATEGSINQVSALQLQKDEQNLGRVIITLAQEFEHSVKLDHEHILLTVYEQKNSSSPSPSLHVQKNGIPSSQTQNTSHVMPVLNTEVINSNTRSSSLNTNSIINTDKTTYTNKTTYINNTGTPSTQVQHIQDVQVYMGDILKSLPSYQASRSEVARVSIRMAHQPKIKMDQRLSLQPILVLEKTQWPSNLEKKIDAQAMESVVNHIMSYQAQEEIAVLRVQLRQEVRHEVSWKDGELHWHFFQDETEAYQGLAQASNNRRQNNTTNRSNSAKRKKRYLGKKIKINIKDADIHNVLRWLADCGRVNIVTSDDVQGTVTLMLNQVPWDQALDIILRTKGLDMVREGNIIRVALRESIAAERKAELEKNQIKEQLKPVIIRLITVNHAEGKDMVTQVKGVLSERGTVNFDLRTNTLIIKDVEEHIDASEDLVRRLDTQTPQVLIEARIVEVNKVNEKEFGIQWGGNLTRSVGLGNSTGLAFPSSVGVQGAADDQQLISPGVPATPNFMINLPATVGAGAGGALGLSLGSVDGSFNLNVRLSAAASRGTVKIVSSPKITTLDNKKAVISQGVSIPISQISAQGVQTTFFDATLKLEVTPHVTQDGNIYLQLKANNDTPDFQNVGSRGDPTILKKEASTQVLLQDGETTVIGGIYTSNAGQSLTEFPYLSQIPILGALFRSSSERNQRNELLIFITPKVINRLASQVNTQ